jgi:hypothetical protein
MDQSALGRPPGATRDAGKLRPIPLGKSRALRRGVEGEEATVIFERVAGRCLADPATEIELGDRLQDIGKSGCNDVGSYSRAR